VDGGRQDSAPSTAQVDQDDAAQDAAGDGAQGEAGVEHEEPPVAHWDEFSLASIRARLRYYSVHRLQDLREYEQAHAARPGVLSMLDKRIAVLQRSSGEAADGDD
jgi:hypothetical protein